MNITQVIDPEIKPVKGKLYLKFKSDLDIEHVKTVHETQVKIDLNGMNFDHDFICKQRCTENA